MRNVDSKSERNTFYLLFSLLLASFLLLLCDFVRRRNLEKQNLAGGGFTSSSDGSFVGPPSSE